MSNIGNNKVKCAISLGILFMLITTPAHRLIREPRIDRSGTSSPDNEKNREYTPEKLNFTLDKYREFEDLNGMVDNITFLDRNGDGWLRLSTGLPDITVTSSYSTSEPVYGETVLMESGSFWSPDGTDTVEIYARNFIIKSGATLDVSGTGNNFFSKGNDGGNGQWWQGGGGGGGGGYGGKGGGGGVGGRGGGSGGTGGGEFGNPGDFEIYAGGPGGEGGNSETRGGESVIGGGGSKGGGIVKIVAENMFINGSIKCNGVNGAPSKNAPGGNQGTGGGGGGGAGGGILLYGREVSFGSHARLSAKGGDGGDSGRAARNWRGTGGGGGGGAGGRLKIFSENPLSGEDNITAELEPGDGGEAGSVSPGAAKGDDGIVGEGGNPSIKNKNFEFPLEYNSYGVYVTKALDTGDPTPHYDDISFSYNVVGSTSVEIFTQTAPASENDPDIPGEWSDWTGPYLTSPMPFGSLDQRFLRLKIEMKNKPAEPHLTPLLDRVRVEYHTDERPSELGMATDLRTLNAAMPDHANLSVVFKDTDISSTDVFSGILKLRDNVTGEELVLMNGTFVEQSNCTLEMIDNGSYELIYVFTPREYANDGVWELYFEVNDGITPPRILDYNDTSVRLDIFTNHAPKLIPVSLSVSEGLVPIPGNYTTDIFFGFEEEDPYPLDEFIFTVRIDRMNGNDSYALVDRKNLSASDGLEIVVTRGKYELRYSYDPDSVTQAGIYGIMVEVVDGTGAYSVLEPGDTDVELELLDNTPPSPTAWILPNETGEQTPRIVWDRGSDPDGDGLSYYLQIGTTSFGNEILVKTSTGENNFFDITEPLPFGKYHLQVWVWDGRFFSEVHQEILVIDEEANSPPKPPAKITPEYTKEIFPIIEWEGAYDADGDNLTYLIRIEDTSTASRVLPKRSTGADTRYKVEEPLSRGKSYNVLVWSFDGKEESYPRTGLLSVLTKGNHRPRPPTTVLPDITGDTTPTISWSEGLDEDGDNLTYFIQIGTSAGEGDILHWSPTGSETSFTVPFNLSYREYFLQIKCSDSLLDSEVLQTSLKIYAFGNIPPTPPTSLEPRFTVRRYPDIIWNGSYDENEKDREDLVYFIQIGATPGGNELLSWQMTTETFYNTSVYLPDGVYYVQVRASDGKSNSSVFQRKMYLGTFKLGVKIDREELMIKKGNVYQLELNVTNRGTLSDSVTLSYSDIDGIIVEIGDELNFDMEPGESYGTELTVTVLNTFNVDETPFEITATSMDGSRSVTTVRLKKYQRPSGIGSLTTQTWFWAAVLGAVLVLGILITVLVKRRGRGWDEPEDQDYTETVEEKKESEMTPIVRRKKSGMVTRVSDTPLMEPKAKRIAMAIYGAEQTQLTSKRKKDLPQLPSSALGLPEIMMPGKAVGVSASRKAKEIKALPEVSSVKDIDKRAALKTPTDVSEGSAPKKVAYDKRSASAPLKAPYDTKAKKRAADFNIKVPKAETKGERGKVKDVGGEKRRADRSRAEGVKVDLPRLPDEDEDEAKALPPPPSEEKKVSLPDTPPDDAPGQAELPPHTAGAEIELDLSEDDYPPPPDDEDGSGAGEGDGDGAGAGDEERDIFSDIQEIIGKNK